MTCFHPMYRNFKVPCGQCTGCRLERSRQWAVRMMHEAKSHADNCFITLTYSDDFLPTGKTLVLKDFQDFMKRLVWIARRLSVSTRLSSCFMALVLLMIPPVLLRCSRLLTRMGRCLA